VSRVSAVEGGGSLMVAWRLAGRRVLVVGGGPIAADRVRAVLEADADVVLVAPRVVPELRARVERGEAGWRERRVAPEDLDGADMVLVAVDDEHVGAWVSEACRARRIPVSVADQPGRCDFWFPSVVRDGPVQIAVSTGGNAPALARRLRERIAAALPAGTGEAVARFGRLRQTIRTVPGEARARMAFLADVAARWSWDRLAQLDDGDIAALTDAYASGTPAVTPSASSVGRIRLVGAGPGDPDLLTVAAARALSEADLVLADRRVPDAVLALVHGELVIARKAPGRSRAAQDELDAAGIAAVRAGRDVVRLKIGDPFVLGRGGEEIAAYRAAGVEPEVIAGLSSALYAPLAAAVPATMRGHADRVLIATGSAGGDGALAQVPAFDPDTTVVLLMAVGHLPALPDALAAAGWPADWPAAIVERASWPDQRVSRGTVGALGEIGAAVGVRAPAVVVLGRVVEALAQPAGAAAAASA
jgi:uroporphyrin-III C-methyltransferase